MAAPGMDLNIDHQQAFLSLAPRSIRGPTGIRGKNESLNLGSKQTWAIGLPGLSPDRPKKRRK